MAREEPGGMRERRDSPRSAGSSERRRGDPLDQRLDRWVNAGRQLVDGVSGTRPGLRSPGRGDRGDQRGGLREGINGLGRWMEHQLDHFLEDEDDWREPWQQERAGISGPRDRPPAGGRRPLEAVSRRGGQGAPRTAGMPMAEPQQAEEWPDEETFSLPRWRRPRTSPPEPTAADQGAAVERSTRPAAGRPLPRSSRRRPDP